MIKGVSEAVSLAKIMRLRDFVICSFVNCMVTIGKLIDTKLITSIIAQLQLERNSLRTLEPISKIYYANIFATQ